MFSRQIILIAGLSTMGALAAGEPMRMPIRRRSYYDECPTFICDPPRAKVTDERMTKREHREMMQRDFARGGNRPGRRRRNRTQGTKWKS